MTVLYALYGVRCLTLSFIHYVFVTLSVQNKKNHSVQTSLSVIRCRSSDDGEGGAVPDPSVVDDNVGRDGDERSVVSVELARPVRRTVVAGVTNR